MLGPQLLSSLCYPLHNDCLETIGSWLSLSLVIACGYSAAFVWNYGDGSYIRVSSIAVFVALPILWVILDEGKNRAFLIVVPFLYASVFYSHQRYAVLLTIYMIVLGFLFVFTRSPSKRLSTFKTGLASGALSVLLLLPLFSNFIVFLSLGEGTPIGNIELNRSLSDVYQNYVFLFHSKISWVVAILGIVVSVHKLKHNVILLAATIQVLIWLYFVTPPLVSNITPFLVPLAYARVVALDPVVFGKFCLEAVFLITLSRGIHKWFSNGRQKLEYFLITTIVFLVFCVVFIQDILLYIQNDYFRNTITNFLPTPYLTHWFSLVTLMFAITFLIWHWIQNRGQDFAIFRISRLLLTLLAVYWALDIFQGRLNYQYHTQYDSRLAEWLRNNTSADSTLIFKGCNLDPFETDIRKTRPNIAQNTAIYQWTLDWIPALAGRKSVCNRLHFVGYKSRVFDQVLSPPSGFYQAHKLLYGSKNLEPGNHFAALGITHVITSYKTIIMRGNRQLESPYLQQVYKQKGLGYTVYKVIGSN